MITDVREWLKRLVEGWEHISISVYQDDRLQILRLSEVRDQRQVCHWIMERLYELP